MNERRFKKTDTLLISEAWLLILLLLLFLLAGRLTSFDYLKLQSIDILHILKTAIQMKSTITFNQGTIWNSGAYNVL